MKYIIFFLIAFVAGVATVANRQSFVLNPMDWTAIYPPTLDDLPVATKQDLLIHFDLTVSEIMNGRITIAIRRRNNEGVYEKVGNISLTDSVPSIFTNGKWIGLIDQRMGGPIKMYHIGDDNILSGSSTIHLSLRAGGYLLSDDTVVGFDPTNDYVEDQYSVNMTLRTHQYNAINNTWTPINGTELTIAGPVAMFEDFSTYRVYDEYMVIGIFTKGSSNFTVNIYERLSSKSWSFIEAVPITGGPASSAGSSIFYNGVDTIAVGWGGQDDFGIRAVSIHTKKNGVWTAPQNLTTTDSVGYTYQKFAASGTFLNANTFLQGIGSRFNTDESIPNAGGVLIFTRQEDGDWKPTMDLKGSSASTFGSGIGVNDHDIIVSGVQNMDSYDASFYATSRCFMDPINVTCHNPQLNDCSEISLNQLYTINNPQCGATSVTFDGLAYNEYGGQARFTFTREGLAEVQCNASVTCTKNIPITAPMLEVPVAESVTSNSNSLQVGLYLAVIMFISFL